MSQHVYETKNGDGKAVTVMIGYERRLDYVFCTVADANGDLLYTSISDENAGFSQQEVDYFRHVLEGLGVKVPQSVFEAVEKDQIWLVPG